MFKLIGELLVVYLLYVVIFNFIIPIYNASKQVKSTMNNVQEKMREQQKAAQPQAPQEPVKKASDNSDRDNPATLVI